MSENRKFKYNFKNSKQYFKFFPSLMQFPIFLLSEIIGELICPINFSAKIKDIFRIEKHIQKVSDLVHFVYFRSFGK